jgi:hypothetical protein
MNTITDQSILSMPERAINPPEFPDWTPQDLKDAADKIVYDILYNGEPWDENNEGWRGDLHVTWEATMLQYMQGAIDREDAMADMRMAFENHVERHAQDEVRHDPNKYCEAVGDY